MNNWKPRGPQMSPGTFSIVRERSVFGRGAAADSPIVPILPPRWTPGQRLPNDVCEQLERVLEVLWRLAGGHMQNFAVTFGSSAPNRGTSA